MHAATLMTSRRGPAVRGFTLIELMVVLAIAAIVTMVGLPNMVDFIAEQRVRTVASDMVSEIAFSRAKAIELTRRVVMERIGGSGWDLGWRTYVDVDGDGGYTAGTDTLLKVFDGFGTGAATATGRLYICGFPASEFGTRIVFRPDGRILRANNATTVNDGIWVIDPMGNNDFCDNKTRALYFDLSGRISSKVVKSGSTSCPGVPPPC